jgi:hypothetical protein
MVARRCSPYRCGGRCGSSRRSAQLSARRRAGSNLTVVKPLLLSCQLEKGREGFGVLHRISTDGFLVRRRQGSSRPAVRAAACGGALAPAATRRHRRTGLTLPTGPCRSNHQDTRSTRPARCPTRYVPNQASTPAWSQGWYQNSEILPSRKCTTKTSLVEKVSPPRRMVPRCRTIPCLSSAR